MKVKVLAVFSGGLDSIIAVKIVQEQGIDVLGITFETPFFSSQKARDAAEKIGLPLIVLDITKEHLQMLMSPRYGYGKNLNPCIDCHTLMLKIAGGKMNELGADFIITGEVLGQRPMSQGKQMLSVVAKNSGFPDYILRPLSAKLLPETKPEREGKIKRQQLLDIQGRGRKIQIMLAEHYGIFDYAPPAGGCLLTDPMFTKRLKDLFNHKKDFRIRDIELLKFGRHFRIDEKTKIVVGRNKVDNEAIQKLAETNDATIFMSSFRGPIVLVPEAGNSEILNIAATLCASYSDAPKDRVVEAICTSGSKTLHLDIIAAPRENITRWMI
ncbi:MAG: putative tRNA sulfurtransferase [Syntrophus sp. PtaB.Bin001]|nr:MAG: putative tRNA sulfurtransferase [Syntrophus sp. PtaB.Bin001]